MYFSLIGLKYSDASFNKSRSSPKSYSVPLNAKAIGSVGGCDVPSANGESAVSIISAPASIAFIYVKLPSPLVA